MEKECPKGEYKDNTVVTHFPLICFGGYGQPRCEFLKVCMEQNDMKRNRFYRALVEQEKRNEDSKKSS